MGIYNGRIWWFLKKIKIELSSDSTIQLLSMYSKNPENQGLKDIFTHPYSKLHCS
jgi:hypothetical protein